MFAAAGLVHGAIWLTTVDRLAAFVQGRVLTLEKRGWRVVLGPAQRSGWPQRAVLAIGAASIAGNGLSWRAERVVADTALQWPGTGNGPIDLRPAGQWVRFGSSAERAVLAQELTIQVAGDGAALHSVNLGMAGMFESQAMRLRLGQGSLTMDAQHIRLSDAAGVPGLLIDAVALDATLVPNVLPGGLPTTASERQSEDGVADVSGTLTAGSLRLSGKARLWLDQGRQPRLEGMVHVTGYAAGLDEVAKQGILSARTATAAKAVLSVLAAPSADDGADIPVQIADGTLTVSLFPLARLPSMEWSAPTLGP